ncbi:MAG TPA: YetF domain-containing protein [Chloroflexota bacterium]|nr:YetF domain-containing protein [Chloroflexota bacterium]
MCAPAVLVHDGQVIPAQLREQCMTRDDLMEALRRRGYDRLQDVRYAVLEADGCIAVIPREMSPS